ncbi:hypothetical protein SAMN05216379_12239, partial [Nitrosomonas eutropha]
MKVVLFQWPLPSHPERLGDGNPNAAARGPTQFVPDVRLCAIARWRAGFFLKLNP